MDPTNTMAYDKGKDERDDGDGGCGGTTVVIQQSNDLANTQLIVADA
jgi:hypothetical protein